jgi:hypothetical protein
MLMVYRERIIDWQDLKGAPAPVEDEDTKFVEVGSVSS